MLDFLYFTRRDHGVILLLTCNILLLKKDSKGDSEIIRAAFLVSKVGVIVKWVSTGQMISGQVCRGGTTQAMGARLVHRKSCGESTPTIPDW